MKVARTQRKRVLLKALLLVAVLALGLLALFLLLFGGAGVVEVFREGTGGKRIAVAIAIVPGVLVAWWTLALWRQLREL